MSDDVTMPIEDSVPLWRADDMIAAMNARPVNGTPARVDGISIDSRTIKPGDAFFAVAGDKFDGHDYASAAARAGASVLVVSADRLPALGRITVPMMVVGDVLEALRGLARAARFRSKAKIVAITGSAGKTTTKDALAHVLSKQGATHASAASFNNHWGVPLTLARMPVETRFGVFEIGMNHHNEITPLVDMVKPHVAIVTLIAAAHLGHFKDLDDIAKAKAEIFSGLVDGGTALINRDDKRFELLSTMAKDHGVGAIMGYGNHKQAKVRLVSAKYLSDCSTVKVNVDGIDVAAKIGIPGKHVALNMTGVLGAVALLGGDPVAAGSALADLNASPGRGVHHTLPIGDGSFSVIDESYNANPASMQAAMETMANMTVPEGARRIAVLGDMLEMGDHAKRVHRALAPLVLKNDVDVVRLAGPEMKALADKLTDHKDCQYFDSTDDLIKALEHEPRAGDIITVKSSNGIGFSRIVKMFLETYPSAKS